MLNKIITTCLYPVIEILPATLAEKIKIIGCVIVGDWHFCNRAEEKNFISKISIPEALEHFKGLDDNSLKNIEHYITYHKLMQSLLFPRRHIVNLDTKITIPSKAKRRLKKFHLEGYGVDSFSFRHGLDIINEEQKTYIKEKTFIDAGAYIGDSSLMFLENGPKKIYAFEPFPSNIELFHKLMRQNEVPETMVELVPLGLSDAKSTIYSDDSFRCSNSPTNPGDTKIEVDTLDDFLKNRDDVIGFIKADIEGMGVRFLNGAKETILRDRPIVSLAIYHNQEEFFGGYDFFKSLGYKIKIEIFIPWHCEELTLFAIPEELT